MKNEVKPMEDYLEFDNPLFGWVYAASGVHKVSLMDWALIWRRESRAQGTNNVSLSPEQNVIEGLTGALLGPYVRRSGICQRSHPNSERRNPYDRDGT